MFQYFIDFYINTRFGAAFIVTELMFVISVAVLANRINFNWKGIGVLLLQIVGIFAFVQVANGLLYFIKNIGNTGEWQSLLPGRNCYLVAMLLYFALFSKYKWKTKLTLCAVFYSAFYAIMGISEAIGYVLRVDYGVDGMTIVFHVIADILLAVYLYLLNFDEYEFVPSINLILMIVTSLLTIIIVLVDNGSNRQGNAITETCLLTIEMLTYYMFYSVSKQYNRNLMRQIVSDKRAGARDMLETMRANQENVHAVLHDVKNQMATLKQLLGTGQYQRANEFLEQFELFATPAIEAIDSGNVVIDAALTTERAKAQKVGIKMDILVAVPPLIPISDSDIVSIICNLTDNAIEACVREKTCADGVSIKIQYHRNYLFITVQNAINETISRDERLKLHSSKNSFTHGYGIKIVKTLVEKHDGAVKFDVVDNKFIVNVMLASADNIDEQIANKQEGVQ